jgi:hypothetical protein
VGVARSFRYRGRATLRKQAEPAPGSKRTDALRGSPRVAAFRGNPRRSCVTRKKRKVVMAIVPARNRESRRASVRRVQLQKSAGSILTSNKLARSAPKRVAVRVNGGLAGVASGTQVSESRSAKRSWRSAFIQSW